MKKLSLHEPKFEGNELKYLQNCIKSTWVSTSGKYIDRFEKNISRFTKSKYAIALNSGTSALHISLLIAGVRTNDEVIAPTLTFVAPINAIKYVNASPIFMDCDSHFNLDEKKTIEFIEKETYLKNGFTRNKSTNKIIKAIIVVHVFGNAANVFELFKLCKKRNIKIIEDASESLGTFYKKNKKHTGTLGDIGCISFNGNKIITSGSGGMILTNKINYSKKIRYLINQAKNDHLNFIHNEIGFNYGQTNLSAALGLAQFENIKNILKKKEYIHNKYKNLFSNTKKANFIDCPNYANNNYWLNIVKVNKNFKNRIINLLIKNNILARPIWHLNHKQKKFKHCQSYKIKNALDLQNSCICLPSSYDLCDKELIKISSFLK